MIGSLEVFVVLIATLLIFGPDKIPEFAHSLGKAVGDFKKAQRATELGLNDLDLYHDVDRKDVDRKIMEMAISSGIDVRGKSSDELLDLLADVVKAK
ncbi:twin-arginine translocase TatA/TatE family subunit [Methanococcoides seepicolus]|uniref:Twin-arginine translocase TatA/TatE family subunit n=1 Tax=Methanococcoides seepicolus TaxID=2828780 RepID=A0A9E4ZCR1_9EURY|nr:twin-arginine translocase TatA/TatE family subunit [Methanococcoides seepicolus]MCM1985576.1 twin-arginine translocase TatA/TatE family subunit [Methanococcoides seepicolus]